MEFPKEQIDTFKASFENISHFSEGGKPYFLIGKLILKVGSREEEVTALLSPTERDGYSSRLFFNRQFPVTHKNVNWNGQNVRIGEQNWFAISYKVPANLTLVQMVAVHMGAFR